MSKMVKSWTRAERAVRRCSTVSEMHLVPGKICFTFACWLLRWGLLKESLNSRGSQTSRWNKKYYTVETSHRATESASRTYNNVTTWCGLAKSLTPSWIFFNWNFLMDKHPIGDSGEIPSGGLTRHLPPVQCTGDTIYLCTSLYNYVQACVSDIKMALARNLMKAPINNRITRLLPNIVKYVA